MSDIKKILHIFPESMFINDYFNFIDNNFSSIIHDLIIINIGGNGKTTKLDDKFSKLYNVKYISTFKLSDVLILNKYLKNSASYDNIIFHSLYLNYLLLALLLNLKVVRKATLTLWGGQDVGPFKVPETKRKYLIFGWFYEKIRKIVIKEFKYIGAIKKYNYDRVKSLYNVKGKYKDCKYVFKTFIAYNHIKKNNFTNIQISNSGSSFNMTLESLEILKKYKNENIRIFCPLSYGDTDYIIKVIDKGKEIFGKKFIPLTKQMSFDNFSKLLSYMDIFIHNSSEQIGLGSVLINIFHKNKVYLNSKGILYFDLIKDDYHIYKIEDICKQDFNDFTKYDIEFGEKNKIKAKGILENEGTKEIWDDIFFNKIDK